MMQQRFAEEAPRLRSYLDELEKPLSSVGEEERREWRAEAEEHLRQLIAANEELGSSREEAISAAIKQFGNTQTIGRNVAREIQRQKQPLPSKELGPILFFSLPIAFGAPLMAMLGIWYQSETSAMVHRSMQITALLLFVLLPSVSGAMWARLRERNARHAIWLSAGLVYPLYGFFTGCLYATMFELRLGSDAARSVPAVVGPLCFSLLALFAAWVTKRQEGTHAA